MKVCKAPKSVCSIQNISVPNDIYHSYGYGTNVVVNIAETHQVLGRIRLCDDVSLSGCCFVDSSVILPGSSAFDLGAVTSCGGNVSKDDITVVSNAKEAEKVKVNVVCSNIANVTKCKEDREICEKMTKEFLKLIWICEGCVIFCESAPELNFFCIVVTKVTGKSAYVEIGSKTTVVVGEIMSKKKFTQIQTLPRNSTFDALFDCKDKLQKPTALSKIAGIVTDVVSTASSQQLTFKPDKNILIIGPPGCGKTALVNSVARKSRRVLLTLSCGDIPLPVFIQKISNVIDEAKGHAAAGEPCIILLKHLDRICKSRSEQLTARSKLVIKDVTTRLEDLKNISGICVVGTTSSPEEVDVSLRKVGCFSHEVEIGMLGEEERAVVLERLTAAFGVICSEATATAVARWTPGYVLTDLVAVVRDSANLLLKNKDLSEEAELESYKKAVSGTLASTLRGTRGLVTNRRITFADIGGLDKVKKCLRMSIEWPLLHPEAFTRLGIPPTSGLLLFGPPGCAKTSLVTALAAESGATFLAVSAADLYSPYLGESEKRLCKLFMQARIGAPSIIFIDEIDALVGTKDGNREHGVQERILATLLMEMDGVGVKMVEAENSSARVIVVGATNRPELIDDALKRPGRFDKLVHIPPPDVTERLAILQKLTSGMALSEDVCLEDLAEKTEGCSGADMKSICRESALLALSERGMMTSHVLQLDFYTVLKTFRPSLSEKDFVVFSY